MFQFRFDQFRQQSQQMPGIGRAMGLLAGRPAWVWGTALFVGLLPFAIIIAALAFLAMLTTALLLMLLGLCHDLGLAIRRLITPNAPDHDGRQNVRVIPPHQER